MTPAPIWTPDELQRDLSLAVEHFRRDRVQEPLEQYLVKVDEYQAVVEDLLESTVDLSDLHSRMEGVLTNETTREAFRYLAGPPISEDDLKVLAEAAFSRKQLTAQPAMVDRVAQVVLSALDRRRFPWVIEGREPTEAERNAAVLSSATLLAMRRLETARRSDGKREQEEAVKRALRAIRFEEVAPRHVRVTSDAPRPGQFCAECTLGNRKADIVVGLFDNRILAIECKVSNSATNSVKRLNNDAAAKAEAWRRDFGTRNVVPAAVLSGVYKVHNLTDAQDRGLTLFWAHDLGVLTDWINSGRPPVSK